MHCHPNAPLTPKGRAKVFLAVEAGMTISAACMAFGVSRRWYYRWRPRWQAAGLLGVVDESSDHIARRPSSPSLSFCKSPLCGVAEAGDRTALVLGSAYQLRRSIERFAD